MGIESIGQICSHSPPSRLVFACACVVHIDHSSEPFLCTSSPISVLLPRLAIVEARNLGRESSTALSAMPEPLHRKLARGPPLFTASWPSMHVFSTEIFIYFIDAYSNAMSSQCALHTHLFIGHQETRFTGCYITALRWSELYTCVSTSTSSCSRWC